MREIEGVWCGVACRYTHSNLVPPLLATVVPNPNPSPKPNLVAPLHATMVYAPQQEGISRRKCTCTTRHHNRGESSSNRIQDMIQQGRVGLWDSERIQGKPHESHVLAKGSDLAASATSARSLAEGAPPSPAAPPFPTDGPHAAISACTMAEATVRSRTSVYAFFPPHSDPRAAISNPAPWGSPAASSSEALALARHACREGVRVWVRRMPRWGLID